MFFNHLSVWVLTLLNRLWFWFQFDLLCFIGFVPYMMMSIGLYNDVCFWGFYYYNTKIFYMRISSIYNFYISLYRYYVSEHSDVGEHVAVWLSIQLCIANLGDNCLYIGDLVSIYNFSVILQKIFWHVNEVVLFIVMNNHVTWVHCLWWKVMVKIWLNVFSFFFINVVLNDIIKYLIFFVISSDVLFLCISE